MLYLCKIYYTHVRLEYLCILFNILSLTTTQAWIVLHINIGIYTYTSSTTQEQMVLHTNVRVYTQTFTNTQKNTQL